MKKLSLLLFCSLLLSCTTQEREPDNPVYQYDGGQVSVVDDYGDCFISIKGPINSSLEKAFNKALSNIKQRNCVEKIVMIHSHGGDLDIALHIGREIRANQFSTDMHGYCESACAFIYIGGVRRFVHQNSRIAKDSKLGVHQPASELLFHQCIWDPNRDPIIVQKISHYLVSMLPKMASDTLYKAIFETSCKKTRYMNATFLLNSQIATEQVDFH